MEIQDIFLPYRQKSYTEEDNGVLYMNAKSFHRPIELPEKLYPILAIFIFIACVIGICIIYNVYDTTLGETTREELSVSKNIHREVSLDLPQISSIVGSDDETILQSLRDSGFILYEANVTEDGSGFDIYKIPPDVNYDDAAALFLQGINTLTASQASELLYGSWRLTLERTAGFTFRIRYADFTSGSLEDAVSSAIVAEGLDQSTLGDAGIDQAGNTYQSGSIDIDGITYDWKVSAIDLKEVYDINALPDDAIYVGIKVTL